MGSLRDLEKSGDDSSRGNSNTMAPPERKRYEKLDDLVVVADDRRRGRTAVSINGKMGRIVLYAAAYAAMRDATNQKVEYVQLKMSPRYPQAFWICPSTQESIGAKHILVSGKTMLLSAKTLVEKMGLKEQKTARYEAEWDPANEGLVVDLRRKI
jgi:hypothetical protein